MILKRQSGTGIISNVHDFIKQNKLASRGLGMIPHPAGQVASYLARQAGYGKKKPRKRRTKQVGNGFFTDIGNGLGGLARGIGGGLFGGGKKKRRTRAILT